MGIMLSQNSQGSITSDSYDFAVIALVVEEDFAITLEESLEDEPYLDDSVEEDAYLDDESLEEDPYLDDSEEYDAYLETIEDFACPFTCALAAAFGFAATTEELDDLFNKELTIVEEEELVIEVLRPYVEDEYPLDVVLGSLEDEEGLLYLLLEYKS
jgi:hypothetical protein